MGIVERWLTLIGSILTNMLRGPNENLGVLFLQEGNVVADLGAGSGHYTVALAKRVGHTGQIYAIDINADMARRANRHLKEMGIKNAKVLLGDIEIKGGTKLKSGLCDAVLMTNVLAFLNDAPAAAVESKRILAPDGQLLVIDWKRNFPEEKAEEIFTGAGFKKKNRFDAGTHQWSIVFSNP